MNNFISILLGKETSKPLENSQEGFFCSECYYDWFKLLDITSEKGDSLEEFLVNCYDKEISERLKAIKNNIHIQQAIIAIPVDNMNSKSYEAFIKKIKNTDIVFISFISIPLWAKKERDAILFQQNCSVTMKVKQYIQEILYNTNNYSMMLFYTFDHNDFAIICDGTQTSLEAYLKVLTKIREYSFEINTRMVHAIHDITSIYGYKSGCNVESKINAVISVSGKKVDFDNWKDLKEFEMETIGRYDHLSAFKNITWKQLNNISQKLHDKGVIASRIHIGSDGNNESTINYNLNQSPLMEKYDKIYNNLIDDFYSLYDKINKKNSYYINPNFKSIELMIFEIGFAIQKMLQRGFSKYNGICYIESYLCFIRYINQKILSRINQIDDDSNQSEKIKNFAESLVNISNSFYKNILTLDSSIMHSERRFIMSDPYHLSLFDVPPKLIAYYTAIASQMARVLNNNKNNQYVFLITPDIKENMYVESITENRDIGSEINILVIHINERSIYNVTDTTKCISHEIAHHIGQDEDLRKIRAQHFIKCYIALLLTKGLGSIHFHKNDVNTTFDFIQKIVEDIFSDDALRSEKSDILGDQKLYYYMDNLQDSVHSRFINIIKKNVFDKKFLKLISEHFDPNNFKENIPSNQSLFDLSDTSFSNKENDQILHVYVYNLILEKIYRGLYNFIANPEDLRSMVQTIRFIFKEGYADLQMLMLTKTSDRNNQTIIEEYSKAFEGITDNVDEEMRKISVIRAFDNKVTTDKVEFFSSLDYGKSKNYSILDKAYLLYICEQASEYFLKVKEKISINCSEYNCKSHFDGSNIFLFKSGDIDHVVEKVDNIIDSYIDYMMNME